VGEESTATPVAARNARGSASRWKFAGIYYAIACAFSWIVWIPLVLGRNGLGILHIAPSLPVFACIGTLGPFLACYWVHFRETGTWRAVRFIPNEPQKIVWILLSPMVILFCFFVVFPSLLSSGSPKEWHWHFSVLVGIIVPMLNYNLLGGPLFEEFGWRGFLLPRLQNAMPPWAACVVVGILWAIWHWPLFLVHWVSSPALVFGLIMIGMSLVMAVPFNASGQSVIAAILMHSAFNASSRFLGPFLGDTPTRSSPPPDILIAAAFLLVGVIFAMGTIGRMCAPKKREAADDLLMATG